MGQKGDLILDISMAFEKVSLYMIIIFKFMKIKCKF